jgi:hypothetical protein
VIRRGRVIVRIVGGADPNPHIERAVSAHYSWPLAVLRAAIAPHLQRARTFSMIDLYEVLGAAANAKLAGDRAVSSTITALRAASMSIATAARPSEPAPRPRSRVGGRRRRTQRAGGLSSASRSINALSDDELERVLAERRSERERYAGRLRKDKLSRLEGELASLRRDIGRIDTPTPASLSYRGTPPNVDNGPPGQPRRGSLAGPRRSRMNNGVPDVPAASPMPPPPPPPMALMPRGSADDDEDGDDGVDDASESMSVPGVAPPVPGTPAAAKAEQRRCEKEERLKRREAKRKERETAPIKLTLVDIIRGAGPDPIRMLKPATPKAADLDALNWEQAQKDRENREAEQEAARIELERLAKEQPGRVVAVLDLETNNASDPKSDTVAGAASPSNAVVHTVADAKSADPTASTSVVPVPNAQEKLTLSDSMASSGPPEAAPETAESNDVASTPELSDNVKDDTASTPVEMILTSGSAPAAAQPRGESSKFSSSVVVPDSRPDASNVENVAPNAPVISTKASPPSPPPPPTITAAIAPPSPPMVNA